MTKYTRRLVSETAKDLILAGLSTKQVVEHTRAAIPTCRITEKGVYSYRRDLRREGFTL